MTEAHELCPVCGQQLVGNSSIIEKHVNRHLDNAEEEKSRQVAEALGHQHAPDSSKGCGDVDCISRDIVLSPGERMMKDLEEGDAALASAIAAAEGPVSLSAHQVQPSLRGSLSDSAERFYPNILARLFTFDTIESVFSKGIHVCSRLDLFASNIAGLGWDCGYRNIQMMFSALLHDPASADTLRIAQLNEVPSVPEIAGRIENAWKRGFDAEGAANFGGTLTDKEVWIGATEVYVLLQSLNISACIQDFETPTLAEKKKMFEWIYNHFNNWCSGRFCLLHGRRLLGSKKNKFVPPIFCQWQGHSVTLVGAEKTKNGEIVLIIMDPSRGFYRALVDHTPYPTSMLRRRIDHPQFAQPRFQLVSVAPRKSFIPEAMAGSRRRLMRRIIVGGSS